MCGIDIFKCTKIEERPQRVFEIVGCAASFASKFPSGNGFSHCMRDENHEGLHRDIRGVWFDDDMAQRLKP